MPQYGQTYGQVPQGSGGPPRALPLIVGAVFAAVGLVLLIVGVVLGLHTRSFLAHAERTHGTVVDVKDHLVTHTSHSRHGSSHSYTDTEYCPVVAFEAGGDRHTFESDSCDSSRPSKGEAVKVAYDPDDPSHASIDSGSFGNYAVAVGLGLMGLLFLVIGVVVLIFGSRLRPRSTGSV